MRASIDGIQVERIQVICCRKPVEQVCVNCSKKLDIDDGAYFFQVFKPVFG